MGSLIIAHLIVHCNIKLIVLAGIRSKIGVERSFQPEYQAVKTGVYSLASLGCFIKSSIRRSRFGRSAVAEVDIIIGCRVLNSPDSGQTPRCFLHR